MQNSKWTCIVVVRYHLFVGLPLWRYTSISNFQSAKAMNAHKNFLAYVLLTLILMQGYAENTLDAFAARVRWKWVGLVGRLNFRTATLGSHILCLCYLVVSDRFLHFHVEWWICRVFVWQKTNLPALISDITLSLSRRQTCKLYFRHHLIAITTFQLGKGKCIHDL